MNARHVIICVALVAFTVASVTHAGGRALKPQNGYSSVVLGFPGEPGVHMCIPDSIEASYLPDDQSVSFGVLQAHDGSVTFVRRDEKAGRDLSQILMVAAYLNTAAWQEVLDRQRAVPGSTRIGEFLFKSIEPSVNHGRYFAVSTLRPVFLSVDMRPINGVASGLRRAQLTSIVDGVAKFINRMDCK